MHKRNEIKNAFKEILLGKTSVGDKVFLNRALRTTDEDLPCVIIYTGQESLTKINEQPRQYLRNLNVIVEIQEYERHLKVIDDQLENLTKEVEKEILLSNKLTEIANDFDLIDVDFLVERGENERIYGAVRLSFNVEYYTDNTQVTEANLNEVYTDIKSSGHDDDPAIEDISNIEQGV